MRIASISLLALAVACSRDVVKTAENKPAVETKPAGAPAKRFITSASGVRLRATAAADGAEVARLPIGMVLTLGDASPDPAWAHVKTSDDRAGWISTTVIRELDPEHPELTYLALVQERNAKEDLSFPERADLYFAISHVIENTRDHATLAKLELARIVAMKKALDGGVQLEGDAATHYKGFAKQLGEAVAYNEPAGEYVPDADKLWLSAKAFKDVPEGELIAWEAATTPLPGECEGSFACYVSITNSTYGNYLKLYPTGAHAGAALKKYEELGSAKEDVAYDEWDASSVKDADDALKEADTILAGCDPNAAKAAKALVVKNQQLVAKKAKSAK